MLLEMFRLFNEILLISVKFMPEIWFPEMTKPLNVSQDEIEISNHTLCLLLLAVILFNMFPDVLERYILLHVLSYESMSVR